MNKKIFSIFLFFFGIYTTSYFAAAFSVPSDSTRTSKSELLNPYTFKLSLESNPFYFDAAKTEMLVSPKNYWRNFSLDVNENELPVTLRYERMAKRVRTDLDRAFSYQAKFEEKRSLGVVGKILGYASTAAAGYLLIKHVTKYADEYKKDFGIK